MKLWGRIKRAFLWVRALEAERREQFAKALRLVNKIDEILPLEPWGEAFKAMLLVRTGDTDAAHRIFADLRRCLRTATDADGRYTRRYVQSWLATLRGDPSQARYEHREAAKIDCRSALKRWLWLPGEPPENSLDAEFNAWLEANHPDAEDVAGCGIGSLAGRRKASSQQ